MPRGLGAHFSCAGLSVALIIITVAIDSVGLGLPRLGSRFGRLRLFVVTFPRLLVFLFLPLV